MGAGSFSGPQATLALEFYQQIVEQFGDNAQISLTGHSLGGGLAGFVGSLYGKDAVLFDAMPFSSGATALYRYVMGQVDASTTYGDHLSESDVEAWALRNQIYGEETPWAPNFSKIKGYYVEGEALQWLRAAVEWNHHPHGLDAGASLGIYDLHKQSLLTLLLYGEKQVSSQRADWVGAKEYLVTALFNHGVGKAAGAERIEGTSNTQKDFAEILRTTLAYSMIDGGTYHFGDSGIHALFDDANDLGRALSLPNATRNLQSSAQALAQSFTQYAGQLTIGKVEAAQGSEERAGVLTLSPDETTLSVDFGQERWRAGMKDAADPQSNPGHEALPANDNRGARLRMAACG